MARLPLLSRLAAMKEPLLAVLIQFVVADSAVALGIGAGISWVGIIGVVVAVALAASVSRKGKASRGDWLAWWGASLVYPLSLSVAPIPLPEDLVWGAVFACLPSVSALVASLRLADALAKAKWRLAAMAWGFAGLSMMLCIAYVQNLRGPFYAGVVIGIVLLSLYKAWYRPRAGVVQALNTGILLSVGLLLLGLLERQARPDAGGEGELRPVYRYAEAMKDPAGFRRWWSAYTRQWGVMIPALYEMHPGTPLFYRPRPGAQAKFFWNPVALNRLGLRGREVAEPKGNTYRIVALGESTTFGSTIRKGEQTWPEMLEQMVRERLHPARPVEVVNAGIPSFGLTNNLQRLATDILPLKPDLLLSYHGYNGFQLLYRVAPPAQSVYPPVYNPRPVKLLAECEYRLRVLWYRHERSAQRLPSSVLTEAMHTPYAEAYRTLINVARTNRFHLALSTYSMAVNRQSEPEVIAFFQTGFPDAPVSMQANEVHSLIVRQLCQEHPEVVFVDSRPALDGQHDVYLDLMHLDEEGDRRLAETMFAAIRPVLERDLASGSNAPVALKAAQ